MPNVKLDRMPSRKQSIVLCALAVAILIVFNVFQGASSNEPVANWTRGIKDDRTRVAAASTIPPTAAVNSSVNSLTVRDEILWSTNLRATYEKYKSVPDRTGEIAFLLSSAIDDCLPIVDRSFDQISTEMNSVGRDALRSFARTKLIERLRERCKGFQNWGSSTLAEAYDALRARAIAANHSGAIALTLATRLRSEGPEKLDAKAIELLSGRLDDAVLKGVFDYLSRRNGAEWFAQRGDPATIAAAWTLLQCNYGAACDGTSRVVIMGCLYYAVCDQYGVLGILPVMYPSLTPEKIDEASRTAAHIVSQIQNRDWARLGFSPKQGAAV